MAKGIQDRLWDALMLLPSGDHALVLELVQKLCSPRGPEVRVGLIELLHQQNLRWESIPEGSNER
jgi:hypothetical protein